MTTLFFLYSSLCSMGALTGLVLAITLDEKSLLGFLKYMLGCGLIFLAIGMFSISIYQKHLEEELPPAVLFNE